MDKDLGFLAVLRLLLLIASPALMLVSASVYEPESLQNNAAFYAVAMQKSLSAESRSVWHSRQMTGYKAALRNLPVSTHAGSRPRGNNAGGAALNFGSFLENITEYAVSLIRQTVYSMFWIILPRAVLWAPYLPLCLLFLAGCMIDAHYTKKQLSHTFFRPRLSRVVVASWSIAIGVFCLFAALLGPWTLPVTVLAASSLLIGLGTSLYRSIPMIAS